MYSFERSELRTLQNMCKDNEEFLNKVAEMVGTLQVKLDQEKLARALSEERVRELEN